jgi:pantothenate kinase-related protein Tda10
MEKKWKSHTPNPRKKPPAGTTRATPYILGICGGPSSGMSTVAKNIKAELDRSGISSERFTLLDFYKPIRGELK